ncbi:MAG: gamma carbonic anhydrase family protein [Bacteroidetes bacterium]|nr:gamma carbonic anhydrase family protein [Bacteroidota bacterium]
MNGLIPYQGKLPVIHPSVFVAEGAKIIGDVEIKEKSSVWFNTIVRGDVNYIRIGECTNIQDNSVLHVTSKTAPLNIGSEVTVGHNAVLHGCTIEDRCLIGMGAVVLDGARICSNSVIAAGTVVLEGFNVPEGMLAAGVPAKIKRPLTGEEMQLLRKSAENYIRYCDNYKL